MPVTRSHNRQLRHQVPAGGGLGGGDNRGVGATDAVAGRALQRIQGSNGFDLAGGKADLSTPLPCFAPSRAVYLCMTAQHELAASKYSFSNFSNSALIRSRLDTNHPSFLVP